MSNKPNTPETSAIVPAEATQLYFAPDPKLKPVLLAGILQEMGLSGPRIPASELVDRTFIITGAKPFESSFKGGEHAWFCVCVDPELGEVFTTVLGGLAVVDIIDALAKAGLSAPLQVTMRQVQGGRYGRYYVLE